MTERSAVRGTTVAATTDMKTMLALMTVLGTSLAALIYGSTPLKGAVDSMKRTGVVTALRLDMDGVVYIRLQELQPPESEGEGSAQATWFRSPPDRSVAIATEEMLLALVVDTEADEELTIVAEADRSLGGSPESAFPILHITRP